MSREPRVTAPRRVAAPYQQRPARFQPPSSAPAPPSLSTTSGSGGALVPAPADEGAVNSNRGGPRRLTFNNMNTFSAREKKLPPDANVQAAANAKLLQLSERASFYCTKCRRDNIISDSLAVDVAHQMMLCARCFTRIIRPRTYRPSRVVPFPSLLSWLNYKPASVMAMPDDIASRPADAVAPSGERTAAPLLSGGDRPVRIRSLPASAMRTAPGGPRAPGAPGALGALGALGAPGALGTPLGQDAAGPAEHPCCRVWGACAHGETCLFRSAPYDLCVCFLMGLCAGSEDTCRLLHQRVFDLPNAADPMPPTRRAGDAEDAGSAWGMWLARRRSSSNRAEWQLWHNGPVAGLLDVYAPLAAEVETSEKEKEKEGGEEGTKPALKLNFADISAALRGLDQ